MPIWEGLFRAGAAAAMVLAACMWLGDAIRPERMTVLDRRVAAFIIAILCVLGAIGWAVA